MLTALIVVLGALGYLTVGRVYGKVSWDIWQNHPRTSLRARLCFPLSSRNKDVYGVPSNHWHNLPFLMDIVTHDEGGRRASLTWSSFIWPVLVAWTLSVHVLRPPASFGWRALKFVFVGLPDGLVKAPARLKGSGTRLLLAARAGRKKPVSAEPPPSPEPSLALPVPSDDRQEYLQVIRRRGELMVEMDGLKAKEAELARRLGGPVEASKLLDMPGKKL